MYFILVLTIFVIFFIGWFFKPEREMEDNRKRIKVYELLHQAFKELAESQKASNQKENQ